MTDDDLAMSREDEEKALRECVRLGYMTIGPDGKAVITDAGVKRMTGMVWSRSRRRETRGQ